MLRSLFTPGPELNLQQDEKLCMIARRHWVVLVLRLLPLLAVWGLCSAVFLWRLTTAGLDTANLGLFITGSLVFLSMGYSYFDWRNDLLIVTSQRVIYQDATFLVRVQRNELYNRDIQDVKMTTDSIISRQFNYGRINVQTASRLRNIEFDGVSAPGIVREVILRNVNPLRKEEDVGRMRQLVRSKVMGQGTPPAPPPPVDLIPEGEFGRGFLGIIPPVPERIGDSIIWRKHWFFLLAEIADPLLLLLIALTTWSLLRSQGLDGGPAGLVALIIVMIFTAGWMVYGLIEWRDDEYIITPTSVIDIERKPLGRESKRETTWDRIEKVSLTQPNLLSRILRYGNIELSTAGQQQNFTFRRVGEPNRILAMISDYRDHFQRIRANSAFDDTLLLMRYYHELLVKEQEAAAAAAAAPDPPAPPAAGAPLPPTQRLP